jgi:CRISPR/Cas system-associated protein Cas10 (large subunit of type III CRISPR-Cas system)
MTQEEWKEKNNFNYAHTCEFCGFYHDSGEELLDSDIDFCAENGKNEYAESNKSFCRVMRDDGVKDYYFGENHASLMEGCEKWFTEGYL